MSRSRTVQLRSLMTEALYREMPESNERILRHEDPDTTRIATSPIEDERRGGDFTTRGFILLLSL